MTRARTRLLVLPVTLVIATALCGFDVHRDETGAPLRWPDRDVAVFLKNAPHGEVDANVIAKQVRVAIETWNTVPGTKLRLVWGGLVRDDPRFDVFISFEEGGFSLRAGVPTARLRIDGANGELKRARIELNAQHFRFASSESLLDTRIHADLRTTMIHHLGHAIGLSMSRQNGAMMFFLPRAPRALNDDDRAGARYLYGEGERRGALCDPCVSDDQCQGRCLQWPDGRGYCARPCDVHDQCPIGFSCGVWEEGKACLPNDLHCAVHLAKAGASGACANDLACPAALFCLSTADTAFCTAGCNGFCGEFGQCRQVNVNNTAVGLCLKGVNRPFGTPCTVATQCTSLLCEPVLEGGGRCGRGCASGCGAGNVCDAQGISCVIPGDKPVGWPCESGFDCESGLCVNGSGGKVCAVTCDANANCPAGTGCTPTSLGMYCLPFGQPPAGAPCAKVGACGQQMICDIAPGAAAGRCAPRCKLTGDSTDCPAGDRCAWSSDGGGLCKPSGPGRLVGEVCSAEDPCRVDLVCVGQAGEGTCRRPCTSEDDSPCDQSACQELTVSAGTMYVCGEINELSVRISPPAKLTDNFAAQGIVLKDVRAFTPKPVNEAGGCSAAHSRTPRPWALLVTLVAACALMVRRRRADEVD